MLHRISKRKTYHRIKKEEERGFENVKQCQIDRITFDAKLSEMGGIKLTCLVVYGLWVMVG